MKLFIVVLCFFAVALLVFFTGETMPSAIYDFRTDEVDETFAVTTAAGVTTANVTLDNELWNDGVAFASATSNSTGDSPTIDTYASATQVLTVGGLAANTTRTLTVTYDISGLDDYTAAEGAITKIPVFFILFPVLLGFLVIVWFFQRSH